MTQFSEMKSICFVIATKDRPAELRRMLQSLAAQTHLPDSVIVVDSSAAPEADLTGEFASLPHLHCLTHRPPSASAQRNAGIAAAPDVDLIGFLDDDATLAPDALEKMLAFWNCAPSDLGGAAFNMVNHPIQAFPRLKRRRIIETLGVYSARPGAVTSSGWQTMTGRVSEDTYTDWLPSTAAVWRADILKACRFDEFFTGYSYLEDLDFSYTIRRQWRLALVADAHYCHYPSSIRHSRQYSFGKTEVRNRLYFVRKHGLSVQKCWLGLTLRMGMAATDAVRRMDRRELRRALGNGAAMAAEFRKLFARERARSSGSARAVERAPVPVSNVSGYLRTDTSEH